MREVGEFYMEEYVLIGLREPFGMFYLASYDQFVCEPLSLSDE